MSAGKGAAHQIDGGDDRVGSAPTVAAGSDTCRECAARPAWTTDPKRPDVPWNLCVDCLREYAAGLRRRADTILRLTPLDPDRHND